MERKVITEETKSEILKLSSGKVKDEKKFFLSMERLINKQKWGIPELKELNELRAKGMDPMLVYLFETKFHSQNWNKYYKGKEIRENLVPDKECENHSNNCGCKH